DGSDLIWPETDKAALIEFLEELVSRFAERHAVVVRIGCLDGARRRRCRSQQSVVECRLDARGKARRGLIRPPCQVRWPIDENIEPTPVLRERDNGGAEGVSIAQLRPAPGEQASSVRRRVDVTPCG